MRNAYSNTAECTPQCTIRRQLAEIQLSERDRQRAMYALRDAEAIFNAVNWARDGIGSLGTLLLKPVFRN